MTGPAASRGHPVSIRRVVSLALRRSGGESGARGAGDVSARGRPAGASHSRAVRASRDARDNVFLEAHAEEETNRSACFYGARCVNNIDTATDSWKC